MSLEIGTRVRYVGPDVSPTLPKFICGCVIHVEEDGYVRVKFDNKKTLGFVPTHGHDILNTKNLKRPYIWKKL